MITADIETTRRNLITDYVRRNPGPTVDEIATGTGLSYNIVNAMLRKLVADGVVTKTPGLARSIRLAESTISEVMELKALIADQANEIERLHSLVDELMGDRMRLVWARSLLSKFKLTHVELPSGEFVKVPPVELLHKPTLTPEQLAEQLFNYSER